MTPGSRPAAAIQSADVRWVATLEYAPGATLIAFGQTKDEAFERLAAKSAAQYRHDLSRDVDFYPFDPAVVIDTSDEGLTGLSS